MYMNNDFSEQPKIHAAGVLPMRRPAEYHETLRPNDSALRAMTDFTSKFAITVEPERQIDAALADMARLSVRAMLVVRGEGVVGLVTSYTLGGFIHILLVVAIILILIRLIQGRNPVT